MPAGYEVLPTTVPSSYPPQDPNELAIHRPASPYRSGSARLLHPASWSRPRLPNIFKYILISIVGIILVHYSILGAFPRSYYATSYRGPVPSVSWEDAQYLPSHEILNQLDPAAGQPGTFFRDSYPIRSMLAFWDLAEKEAGAKGVNTCGGQLSRELVQAYHDSQVAYCIPPEMSSQVTLSNMSSSSSPEWEPLDPVPATRIWCSPVHRSDFSNWWPYPAAPCVSTDLRVASKDSGTFKAVGCDVTQDGQDLDGEMGRERFLGNSIERTYEGQCRERIEHTMLVVGRQDQWNPFHVAEDLITTMVSVFIAATTLPDLIDQRVQLVFTEGFGMDANHFTPLWDRIGAWAPRRLSLDPWGDDVCLTNAIHSVGAGASLLSAMGVGRKYTCASTITWAAAHYYRHLFGLLPSSTSSGTTPLRRPIHVLWLSRGKLDAYAQAHNDWSNWRGIRHINNEEQLVKRLTDGMAQMCEHGVPWSSSGCIFEDARDLPESWTGLAPVDETQPIPIRFAELDPTVHALETQIHFVGHSTILLSSHGGALGLSLFLSPGESVVVELQVSGVAGNFHFQHLACEAGNDYELVSIAQNVDVDHIWEILEKWITNTGRRR